MTRTVSGRTGLIRRRADEVLVATLTVLSESISAEETRDLLAQLPKSLRERVPTSGTVIDMRQIEFVARVADLLEATSVDEADAYVRAVFATLNEAVNAGEMRDIADELGTDFADLLGRAASTGAPVGERSGLVDRVVGAAGALVTLPIRGLVQLHRVVRPGSHEPSSYSHG